MVLLSFISAMYTPAVMASIPLLVSEQKLEQANGMVNGVQALAGVTAPVLGDFIWNAWPQASRHSKWFIIFLYSYCRNVYDNSICES